MVIADADILPVDGDNKEIHNSVVAALLSHLRRVGGPAVVGAVVDAAGSTLPPAELVGTEGWCPASEVVALFEAARRVTGDPDVARHAGVAAFTVVPEHPVPALLRALGSPAAAVRFIADNFHARSTVHQISCQAAGDDAAVLAIRVLPPTTSHRIVCQYVAGMLCTLPAIFGLGEASVEELACQADGAPACRLVMRWAPAARTPAPEVVPAAAPMALAGVDGLLQAATALSAAADAPAVARLLAESAAVAGGRRAAVLLWRAAEDRLVEAARSGKRAVGGSPRGVVACRTFVQQVASRGRPLPLRPGSAQPVIDDICRVVGFDRGQLLPLVAYGACYGVLAVDRTAWGPDATMTAGLVDVAAVALAHFSLLARSREQAALDPLTGLAGTELLRAHVEPMLADARRGGTTGCMLVVAVRELDAVNRAFGRCAGDHVLSTTAAQLREAARQGDTVARLSGASFAVVLPRLGADQVAPTAERLRRAASVTVAVEGAQVTMVAAVGAAGCEPDDTFDSLLLRATRAVADPADVGAVVGPGGH